VPTKILLKVGFLERVFERDHLAEKMGQKLHCSVFKKASNGLRELSQKKSNCYFIPIDKSFKNGGKINEKYFRDGVHLTPEGSQMYADVLCKRLISFPFAKKPWKIKYLSFYIQSFTHFFDNFISGYSKFRWFFSGLLHSTPMLQTLQCSINVQWKESKKTLFSRVGTEKITSAVFQVVEHTQDSFRMITIKNETFEKIIQKFNFWSILPILATIYEVKITFWKKLVEGAPMTYFQIDIFW
jgi:hypothetical protein